ncbi:hypothetical protein H4Q26_013642 [Puccinia striiformis f. sp. tritici PST-130]|nr:hypothetical protein H4Q26_013642 [Puccinia striiformis f. sp. tritici PST-130]
MQNISTLQVRFYSPRKRLPLLISFQERAFDGLQYPRCVKIVICPAFKRFSTIDRSFVQEVKAMVGS